MVEVTSRRKDLALALVGDLEAKNEELDRAMAEQARAEQDRIRLERELRQAQRLEAVGQLAGGVAHDFNNILAVIMANSELLASALPPERDDLRANVQEVQDAARGGAS